MKRVLYTANVPNHILGFHLPYLKWFKEHDFEVHVAFNGEEQIPHADKVWNVPFGRSPYSISNINSYRKLKWILGESHFDIVHCHTPITAAITRLASSAYRKKGTTVLYTAHGFNFFKGAPLQNWLMYFPFEWALSFLTDAIITINKEDYKYLEKYNFGSDEKFKINGIGIDPSRLKVESSEPGRKFRSQLGFDKSDILVLYIAEFIDRKNHQFIINNIPAMINNNPKLKFLFAGRGKLQDKMKERVHNLGIDEYVRFLGFRKDIGRFIKAADIGISSSKYEGLGLGVAEMMFHKLPVVISNDRGHRELVDHTKNGFIFEQHNTEQFQYYISRLSDDKSLRKKIGDAAKKSMEKFVVGKPLQQMEKIYKHYL